VEQLKLFLALEALDLVKLKIKRNKRLKLNVALNKDLHLCRQDWVDNKHK
jgi:hypothetical protein